MAGALRSAGVHVELHEEHFAPDAPDVEWLAEVGRRAWIVLTKDDAIRRNPLERSALLAAGVRAFIITSQNMSGPDMAALVREHLPAISRVIRRERAPFIAVLTRSGVNLVDPSGRR